MRRTNRKTFPIVGVGASAGGLEALREILEKLPVDTGMGFVLMQDLDPTHARQLTDPLSRATKLPASGVHHLYRIAQEAMFNAVKHSHGKHIYIHLTEERGRIALPVKDDGRGINTRRVNDSDMGLYLMRYHASVIGARLDVRHGPRNGRIVTRVIENAEGKEGADENSKQANKRSNKTTGIDRR